METHLKGNYCPSCNKLIDGAESVSEKDRVPVPGDFGICFYCGELHRFTEEMRSRKLKVGELEEQHPSLKEFLIYLRMHFKNRNASRN